MQIKLWWQAECSLISPLKALLRAVKNAAVLKDALIPIERVRVCGGLVGMSGFVGVWVRALVWQ